MRFSELSTVPHDHDHDHDHDHGRRLRSWVGVLVGGGVVLAAYLLGVVWGVGRQIDDRALRSAERFGAGVRPEVHASLAYLSPALVCVGVVAVVVRESRRGNRLRAVGAVVLVVGSQLLAQAVKLLLPRVGGGTNTLPSGHLTMIAAFVLVLVATGRWRRITVVIGALAVACSAAGTWVIGWHRPSDSLAACGVVALCWGMTRVLTDATRSGRDGQASVPAPPRGPGDRPTVPSTRALARARTPSR